MQTGQALTSTRSGALPCKHLAQPGQGAGTKQGSVVLLVPAGGLGIPSGSDQRRAPAGTEGPPQCQSLHMLPSPRDCCAAHTLLFILCSPGTWVMETSIGCVWEAGHKPVPSTCSESPAAASPLPLQPTQVHRGALGPHHPAQVPPSPTSLGQPRSSSHRERKFRRKQLSRASLRVPSRLPGAGAAPC